MLAVYDRVWDLMGRTGILVQVVAREGHGGPVFFFDTDKRGFKSVDHRCHVRQVASAGLEEYRPGPEASLIEAYVKWRETFLPGEGLRVTDVRLRTRLQRRHRWQLIPTTVVIGLTVYTKQA